MGSPSNLGRWPTPSSDLQHGLLPFPLIPMVPAPFPSSSVKPPAPHPQADELQGVELQDVEHQDFELEAGSAGAGEQRAIERLLDEPLGLRVHTLCSMRKRRLAGCRAAARCPSDGV